MASSRTNRSGDESAVVDFSADTALPTIEQCQKNFSELTLGELIDIMLGYYKQGCSDNQVCARLKMTPRYFNSLLGESAPFKEAVEMGRVYSKAWWEDMGHKNLTNKSFNIPLYTFQTKQKIGWSDKVDATAALAENEIAGKSTDELQDILLSNMPKLQKVLKDRGIDDRHLMLMAGDAAGNA